MSEMKGWVSTSPVRGGRVFFVQVEFLLHLNARISGSTKDLCSSPARTDCATRRSRGQSRIASISPSCSNHGTTSTIPDFDAVEPSRHAALTSTHLAGCTESRGCRRLQFTMSAQATPPASEATTFRLSKCMGQCTRRWLTSLGAITTDDSQLCLLAVFLS